MSNVKKNFIVFFLMFLIVQLVGLAISQFYLDGQISIVKKSIVSFGAGTGIVLSLFSCYLWAESTRVREGLSSFSTPVILASVFSLIALPFGLIVGIIGGGTFFGGWMEVFFEWLHLNPSIGISIGIGLGVFIGSVFLMLPVTIVGFSIGKAIKRK